MKIIDLRSDTITKPTQAMREAMAQAAVGDDVFGDDPTVQELEKAAAAILGKAAAVYTPSGTMANQIALRCHTEPGDEVILEAEAHVYYYEGGGPAALSGVMCRCIQGKRGVFTAEDLAHVLRPADPHFPTTRLVCIENTHNRGGGKVWPIETIHAVADLAREKRLKLHLDGARLWNASVATGITEKEYCTAFDSVSVCFSKGLGAPVGSVLAGTREFISKARRVRKLLGGGMRQAGIVAAGALYALEHHRARLSEDHTNAKILAEGLAQIEPLQIDPADVETNLVRFGSGKIPAAMLATALQERGILMLAVSPSSIRAVTNLMCDAEDMRRAIQTAREVVAQVSR